MKNIILILIFLFVATTAHAELTNAQIKNIIKYAQLEVLAESNMLSTAKKPSDRVVMVWIIKNLINPNAKMRNSFRDAKVVRELEKKQARIAKLEAELAELKK